MSEPEKAYRRLSRVAKKYGLVEDAARSRARDEAIGTSGYVDDDFAFAGHRTALRPAS